MPHSNDSDWESSFTQILSRTKQNLNKINQRYAPTSMSVESLPRPPIHTFEPTYARQSYDSNFYGGNQQNVNPALNTSPYRQHSDQMMKPQVVHVEQNNLLFSLTERLARLEEGSQLNSANSHRLTAIEKSLTDLTNNVNSTFHDMKEIQRNILSLQNKNAVSSGIIEVIQHDNDSKRSVISKMDSWIRQGEVWREDIDEKIATLTKLTKAHDRYKSEQRDMMADNATKYDLEQLRDKVIMQAQQTVSASLSAWYEKVDYSMRNLEKQVALVRIGQSPQEGQLLTPEDVHAALNTSMPSEMLVKGAVATEILQLENKLEEKLQERLSSFLKNEAISTHNNLQKVIRDKINLLCAENGIMGGAATASAAAEGQEQDEGQGSGVSDVQLLEEAQVSERYRRRIVNAKLEAEKELFSLSSQIADIRSTLSGLQNSFSVDQSTAKATLLNMERKVEEAIAIANNSVVGIGNRYNKIEERQRENDIRLSNHNKEMKEELLAKIDDLSKDWLAERVQLDRRLLINENISADCLERIKLSTSVLDTYFMNNKDIQSFKQTSEDVEKLQFTLTQIQNEVRESSNSVYKLNANNVTKNEYVTLVERIAALEPMVQDTLPDYIESTKKLVEYSLTMQSKVSNIENVNAHNNNELQSVSTRLNALETSTVQSSGLATMASEECKLLASRLSQMESSNHSEFVSLKDLTGSMSSRIMTVESKLTLNNKTAASENTNRSNQMAALSTLITSLQSGQSDLQTTLKAVQAAVEGQKKDSHQKVSQLDTRVLQLELNGPAAPSTAANMQNNSYSGRATHAPAPPSRQVPSSTGDSSNSGTFLTGQEDPSPEMPSSSVADQEHSLHGYDAPSSSPYRASKRGSVTSTIASMAVPPPVASPVASPNHSHRTVVNKSLSPSVEVVDISSPLHIDTSHNSATNAVNSAQSGTGAGTGADSGYVQQMSGGDGDRGMMDMSISDSGDDDDDEEDDETEHIKHEDNNNAQGASRNAQDNSFDDEDDEDDNKVESFTSNHDGDDRHNDAQSTADDDDDDSDNNQSDSESDNYDQLAELSMEEDAYMGGEGLELSPSASDHNTASRVGGNAHAQNASYLDNSFDESSSFIELDKSVVNNVVNNTAESTMTNVPSTNVVEPSTSRVTAIAEANSFDESDILGDDDNNDHHGHQQPQQSQQNAVNESADNSFSSEDSSDESSSHLDNHHRQHQQNEYDGDAHSDYVSRDSHSDHGQDEEDEDEDDGVQSFSHHSESDSEDERDCHGSSKLPLKKVPSSDSDASISAIDDAISKLVRAPSTASPTKTAAAATSEEPSVPVEFSVLENSFDESTIIMDQSMVGVTTATTSTPEIAKPASGPLNSSMILNSFDEDTINNSNTSSVLDSTVVEPEAEMNKPSSPPAMLSSVSAAAPISTQKSSDDTDVFNADEIESWYVDSEEEEDDDVKGKNNQLNQSASNNTTTSTTVTSATPVPPLSLGASVAASESTLVPVVAVVERETPPPVSATPLNVVSVESSAANSPIPIASASTASAPAPSLATTAGAVTATLSIKERLRLRQEMLKQQKNEAAGITTAPTASTEAAATQPTVSEPTSAPASVVAAPVVEPVSSTATTALDGIASPRINIGNSSSSMSSSSSSSSSAVTPAATPRRVPPVIPTLTIPTKVDSDYDLTSPFNISHRSSGRSSSDTDRSYPTPPKKSLPGWGASSTGGSSKYNASGAQDVKAQAAKSTNSMAYSNYNSDDSSSSSDDERDFNANFVNKSINTLPNVPTNNNNNINTMSGSGSGTGSIPTSSRMATSRSGGLDAVMDFEEFDADDDEFS